jgi:hypothetical protein
MKHIKLTAILFFLIVVSACGSRRDHCPQVKVTDTAAAQAKV